MNAFSYERGCERSGSRADVDSGASVPRAHRPGLGGSGSNHRRPELIRSAAGSDRTLRQPWESRYTWTRCDPDRSLGAINSSLRDSDQAFLDISERLIDIDQRLLDISSSLRAIDRALLDISERLIDIDQRLLDNSKGFRDIDQALRDVSKCLCGVTLRICRATKGLRQQKRNRVGTSYAGFTDPASQDYGSAPSARPPYRR